MEDAIRQRRLARLANRQQVLVDLLKAATDSLGDLVTAACAAPLVVEPSGGPVAAPPRIPVDCLSPALVAEICSAAAAQVCTCGHRNDQHHALGLRQCTLKRCECAGFKAAPSSPAQQPAEASTTNRDPLTRAVPTRGTLQGLLDRLDDALERGDQAAAQGASRELRNALDQVPL